MDQNILLKEDYFNIIENLKSLYSQGHIVLDKKSMTRFKNYIADEKIFNAIGQVNVYSAKEAEDQSKFSVFLQKAGIKKEKIQDENLAHLDYDDSMQGSNRDKQIDTPEVSDSLDNSESVEQSSSLNGSIVSINEQQDMSE